MGYYLLDHPNPHGPNYYKTRQGSVLACVVHVTAGLQDLDGVDDRSAENTAKYAATTDRAVSWHSGSDTDSHLMLLPDSYTAFQCKGYNSRTIGHEISKTDVDWSKMPAAWVTSTLFQAAECLRPRLKALKIPLLHATRGELDRAIQNGTGPVGLVAHSELDPTRRRDPGADFPWQRFLNMLAGSTAPPAPTPTPVPVPEDDMKHARFITPTGQQYLATPEGLVPIKSQQHLALLRKANLVADGEPVSVTDAEVAAYGVI